MLIWIGYPKKCVESGLNYDERGDILAFEELSEDFADPVVRYKESSGIVVYSDCVYVPGSLETDDFDLTIKAEFGFWDLGRCLEFGGKEKFGCFYLNVVEHVIQGVAPRVCSCGKRSLPYLRQFKFDEIDTFVSINAVHRNSINYLRYLFLYIRKMMWGFIVSVPKILEHDENDPGDIIFQLFPTVEIVDYVSCRFYRLRRRIDIPLVVDNCYVNSEGDPVDENCSSNFRSVVCLGVIHNDICGFENVDGTLDCVFEGKLKYGERILDGTERTWVNVMKSSIPDFHLLGRIDSMHDRDIVFVFLAELSSLDCLRDGRSLKVLVESSTLKQRLLHGLYMLRYFRKWTVDIEELSYVNFRRVVLAERNLKSDKWRQKDGDDVDVHKEIFAKLSEIVYHRNGSWINVSIIKDVVPTGRHKLVRRDLLSDGYRLFKFPLPNVRFYEVKGEDLVYVVDSSFERSTTVTLFYKNVTVYSYVDPQDLIQDMYGMSKESARKKLKKIPYNLSVVSKDLIQDMYGMSNEKAPKKLKKIPYNLSVVSKVQ